MMENDRSVSEERSHPMARPLTGIHQRVLEDDRHGDLSQLQSGLEAIHDRLLKVNSRLAYVYGEEPEAGKASSIPGGKIPKLQSLLECISDEVSRIEGTVERL